MWLRWAVALFQAALCVLGPGPRLKDMQSLPGTLLMAESGNGLPQSFCQGAVWHTTHVPWPEGGTAEASALGQPLCREWVFSSLTRPASQPVSKLQELGCGGTVGGAKPGRARLRVWAGSDEAQAGPGGVAKKQVT